MDQLLLVQQLLPLDPSPQHPPESDQEKAELILDTWNELKQKEVKPNVR